MKRRYLVAGNWKMNGSARTNGELVGTILAGARHLPELEILVCPPAVYLESVGRLLVGAAVVLGAQDLSEQRVPGAFTGELLGAMLAEVGCRYVIVGHSECRMHHCDDDERVARKFLAAQASGLTPILCLGETLEQHETGHRESVLARQLGAVLDTAGIEAFAGAVIAYEPVWAIGTGRTASPQQAQQAHAFLRGQLRRYDAKIADSTRLLYGGSVKADNAAELFACEDVDGGLIGGASLKATDFLAICAAAQARSQR